MISGGVIISVAFAKTGSVLEKSAMLRLEGTFQERFGFLGNASSTSPTVEARFLFKVHLHVGSIPNIIVIDSDLAYLHEYERSTINYKYSAASQGIISSTAAPSIYHLRYYVLNSKSSEHLQPIY
jgi:hypothetical protein